MQEKTLPEYYWQMKRKKYIKKKTVLHLYEEKCLWPSFSPVSIFSILGLSLSSEVPGKMIKIYPTIKKINWKEGRGEGHLQRWNRHGGTNLHLLNLFQTFQTCAFFPSTMDTSPFVIHFTQRSIPQTTPCIVCIFWHYRGNFFGGRTSWEAPVFIKYYAEELEVDGLERFFGYMLTPVRPQTGEL